MPFILDKALHDKTGSEDPAVCLDLLLLAKSLSPPACPEIISSLDLSLSLSEIRIFLSLSL